jgi:hypothetical protein
MLDMHCSKNPHQKDQTRIPGFRSQSNIILIQLIEMILSRNDRMDESCPLREILRDFGLRRSRTITTMRLGSSNSGWRGGLKAFLIDSRGRNEIRMKSDQKSQKTIIYMLNPIRRLWPSPRRSTRAEKPETVRAGSRSGSGVDCIVGC